jgi:hypothetical protein
MATAQVLTAGSRLCLSKISGNDIPVVQTTPPTWRPGLYWVDSSTNPPVVKDYNGTSWSAATQPNRFLALAISDPTDATDMTMVIEVQTAGYARQPVAWSAPTSVYPAEQVNTGVITWGPFTADMLEAAVWVVEVTSASGTTGFALYAWQIDPEQVDTSQNIQVAAGDLTRSES